MNAAAPSPPANRAERFTAWYGILFGVLLTGLGPTGPGLALTGANLVLGVLVWHTLPRLRASAIGPVAFLGDALPLLAFYVYYRECALVLNQPGIAWRDAVLAAFEAVTFGPVPSGSRLLGEWLAFGYMAYVPLIVCGAVVLARRPATRGRAQGMIRQICYAWAACYVVFVLFPVLGPRFMNPDWQELRMGTGAFSALALANQHWGMLRGASFPSAHVAATVVTLVAMWRSPAFCGLLPIAILIPVAAVYLGYHYVSDVAVGALVGAAAVAVDRFRPHGTGGCR